MATQRDISRRLANLMDLWKSILLERKPEKGEAAPAANTLPRRNTAVHRFLPAKKGFIPLVRAKPSPTHTIE